MSNSNHDRANPYQSLDSAVASSPQKGYLLYHLKRFRKLIDLVAKYHFDNAQILDIGNSMFSKILSDSLATQVDELGFLPDSKLPYGHRYQFDLNLSQNKGTHRSDLQTYDVIILAEVIEHIYTTPNRVLQYLRTLLKKDGILIIQTPNATVFHKRLQLLFGRNPYMMINEDRRNPGHYREYTVKELQNYALRNDFEVVEYFYGSYFDYRYDSADSQQVKKRSLNGLINLFYALCPSYLKSGISMVIRKVD